MNFEKYRKADTIKLHGIYGNIYQESENGELIDSMRSKDADWLTGKSVFAKSESFDFEKFVLQELNQHFINKLKPEAICIRDKNLSFYKQEDAEGMEDPKGEYFVSYAVAVSINGQYIDEEDLNNILKNCYTGNDFLKECNGCEKAARALFGFVNWQHPNIQDLVDLYDDEEDEFFKEFGIHFEDVCSEKEKIYDEI